MSCIHTRGVLWLSDRVLDSRLRGCGFEAHRRHCFVSLSKTLNHLLASTGSTQEDLFGSVVECLTQD